MQKTPLTIPASFSSLLSCFSHKTAVIYLGEEFSYKKLNLLSTSFAHGLRQRSVTAGSRVIIYLPNSIQWVIAWLGVLKAGAIAVPITPIYTPSDVEYIADDTGASAIVCTDRNYGYVSQIIEKTSIKQVIVSNLADMLPSYKRLFGWAFDLVPKGKAAKNQDIVSLKKLVNETVDEIQVPETGENDICEIIYTGGTTRHPKGVPITHRLLLEQAHEQISLSAKGFELSENVIMGAAPLFHILGQTCSLGTILLHGGALIQQPRVNLDAMMDAITRHKAKTIIGVPTLYRMILEHDRLDQYDLNSLEYCFCGGDVLPEDVARRWQKRFGKPIYIGYGASETVGGVSMTPTDENPPRGAMGKVLKSKRVKVVDPITLEELGPEESGELLVHSDPMVEEYWNKPQETRESFVELEGKRFYRTGDVVKRDQNNWLFFVDRTVDTIKHKGYRVSASEIECILQDHAAVVGCCVVGVPDEKVGERVKAFVVLKKDIKGITGYDLIKYCRKHLSSYKVPQYIEFRDMLPKSKVGKLLRREVRAEEKSRLD
jgi:long-chain acyl-CoA synthetase